MEFCMSSNLNIPQQIIANITLGNAVGIRFVHPWGSERIENVDFTIENRTNATIGYHFTEIGLVFGTTNGDITFLQDWEAHRVLLFTPMENVRLRPDSIRLVNRYMTTYGLPRGEATNLATIAILDQYQ